MQRHHYGIAILILVILLAGCQSAAPEPAGPDAEQPAIAQETEQPPSGAAPAVTEAAAAADPAEVWQVVKQLQPEHKPKYAAFMNELFGVTGCGSGFQPAFTADGGQTWIQPAIGNFCADSAEIVNGRSVWLCNSYGVFTSKDGGHTLSQMYSPYDGCRILSFADDEHGWSSFEWNIAATGDGALSWTEVEKDFEMGEIAALSLRTPLDGYVMDYYGKLFSTHDGGASWSSTDLGFAARDLRVANMDGRPGAAIRFMDDDHGIIVVNLAGGGNSAFVAYHTADGGQTWAEHTLPLNLGAVFLSHDGQYLTVTEHGGAQTITVLKQMPGT